MPTAEAHIDKQNRTQLALSDLQQSQNRPQHGDWIVTLAFYKALPKSSDLRPHPFRVVIQIGKSCYQSKKCCEITSKMWYTCLGFRGRIAHRRLAVSPTSYAIGHES